ncbi:MAG: virulence RhuM family protein [Eubacterium sp.]|nr:virulence RhuM family protein [Eubacterium sp.]
MEKNEVLIYITEDGTVKLEVTMEAETVWLNLNQLCELFQRDKSVISRHIKNIYTEGELEESSTVVFFATVQNEGGRSVERKIAYYNLDVIISVGYRVKSLRGTQFRKWALKVLKEYMIKGFALDDDRLKNLGGGNYFEELLARIRSIRASEKVFWRKVLDIYATSIDYDPKSEISVQFFKQVQNKMHWAAHRHTAAEVIYERADSEKEFMGLTSWRGEFPERTDAEIAKNYLSREELEILDRLVSAYLDIAELRAMNREPMYMKDWLETIDDYLKMTRRDILTHKGKVSHRQALEKAHKEYEKYSEKAKQYLSSVEKHYLEAVSTLEGIEKKQE